MKKKIPVELPPGFIEFYEELESWENEQEIYLSRKYSLEEFPINELLREHNQPLFLTKDLKINDEDYKDVLSGLLAFIKENRPEAGEAAGLISTQLDNLDYTVIIQNLLQNDRTYFTDMAQELGVPLELLVFLLDHALRPFLRLFARPYTEELAEDEFQSWSEGNTCPVCNAYPQISRLRKDDGRRFMFCDRCFTEWEARYLECIHCGNNEPGSINYFNVDGNESYQIFTCEKCKGYLKTFDERVDGISIDLFIANMETIYLDLLAQDKGYNNTSQDKNLN